MYPTIERAFQWVERSDGQNFLRKEEHAPMRDIFGMRLERMNQEIKKSETFEKYPLLVAIAGELGNNAYDHNLGAWRDEPGVYFSYDSKKRFFVIADRGQGVLATLRDIKPNLHDDCEALKVAFTEIISGRSPEHRGNGLKFVEREVQNHKDFRLYFYSGKGRYAIQGGKSSCRIQEKNYKGVIAVLFF